jgi:hypothetical protein
MDTRRLRIDTSNMMNMNTKPQLLKICDQVLRNLSTLPPPSGAAISYQPAPGILPDPPEADPDVRGGGKELNDMRIVKDGYDSDEEGTGNRVVERAPEVGVTEVGATAEATTDVETGGGGTDASVGKGGEEGGEVKREVHGEAGDIAGVAGSGEGEATDEANEEGAAQWHEGVPVEPGYALARSGAPYAGVYMDMDRDGGAGGGSGGAS